MDIDITALKQAANSLFRDLNRLDDLPQELRNTLANVYYRFFALRRNLRDPSKVLGYENSDFMSTYKGFMQGSTFALADFQCAKGMIEGMRETRKHNPDIYDYMVVLTLDVFKYRIPNAQDKTPIRRAIERKFKKPNEIAGLYERMEPLLKDMELMDHLSQLGNRRHFEARLKELFEASKANGPSSVLMIDMDHFKKVNDIHGHDAGDALIVGFANALRKAVRQNDVLARLGGDEFCIIYTYASLDNAKNFVEHLRRQLPREIPLTKGVIHQLRWTGGLSTMYDKDTKPDDVLWRADQALLQAKEAGRNITKVYDPEQKGALPFIS